MAQPINNDLTQGPIARHFRTLAIPGALGMLFTTLYNIVDMFFAGLLSTSAQAGLALGYQAFFIALSVGIGLGAAMGAMVGNALGAGDKRAARRFAAQGISFGVLASITFAIAGSWYGPAVVRLVSEPGAYQDAGIRYFLLLTFALPGFLLAMGMNGILQAHGDGQSMLRALIAAFFANIALNPLLIYGIPGLWGGMGFDGLAVSTVMSQTGVMLYLVRQVLRLPTLQGVALRHVLPKPAAFAEIAMQVLPIAVSWLVMFLAGFVVQFALKGFGEHAVAGFGLGIRLEQILLLPIQGVTTALLPIAAQNVGAKDFDRVRAAIFFCWRLGLLMSAIAVPIIWLFGRYIVSFFTDDPEVVRVAMIYLRVDSLIFPAYMLLFSVNSILQAFKRPIYSVWISLYRQAFGIAFFVWLFIGVWGFGEVGVWLGVSCAVVTGAMMALWITARVAQKEIGGLRRAAPERSVA